MKLTVLDISGAYLIENFVAHDDRGIFVKTFNSDAFAKNGLATNFSESYYSISGNAVIRGMHFQSHPHEHEKLVYVTNGEILDVILDLRKQSATFGKYAAVNLKAINNAVYIPKGCAHGFLTVSDHATVIYNVSTVYNAEYDHGIRWDSFGFDWNQVSNPVISVRDKAFLPFDEFKSPFN